MTLLFTTLLVVAACAVLFAVRQFQSDAASAETSCKSKPLLSSNEKEFYQRLLEALPDCYVLTQVALGALLQPRTQNNNREYYRARAKFSQKIADYVICNRNMDVLAVVELDDRTHQADRDAKRDAMLLSAGYKVIRWNAKSKPTAEDIRAHLQSLSAQSH